MMNMSGAANVREKLLLVSELYGMAAGLNLEAARRGERLTLGQALERALILRAGGEDEICMFRQALHEGLFGVDVIRVFNEQNPPDGSQGSSHQKAARRGWHVVR
jgi:hypothetical protein